MGAWVCWVLVHVSWVTARVSAWVHGYLGYLGMLGTLVSWVTTWVSAWVHGHVGYLGKMGTCVSWVHIAMLGTYRYTQVGMLGTWLSCVIGHVWYLDLMKDNIKCIRVSLVNLDLNNVETIASQALK